MQVREPMPNCVWSKGIVSKAKGTVIGVSQGGKFLLWTIDGENEVGL